MNDTEIIMEKSIDISNPIETCASDPIQMLSERLLIKGLRKRYLVFRIRFTIFRLAIECYKNPIHWFGVIRYFIRFRKKYLGNNKTNSLVKIDGKYYMGLYTPGWKSKVFNQFVISLLNDYKPIPNKKINRFMFAFVGITKKCPLRCEHCFEWESLNEKEVLTTENIQKIIQKIQDLGVGQIHLTGGEPLHRMDVLLDILKNADDCTDFWVTTSGFNLTSSNAKSLKDAGLTGVVVSVDHFDPEKHNSFRGNKNAFHWAMEAIKNAHSNNLVTALSLCATKDFTSKDNLMAYMEFAKKSKVSFVQLLEPKSVGHYEGKDVSLSDEQIGVMEELMMRMNFKSENWDFPIIIYQGYHQRRHACFSSGYKGIYIDSDGDLNPCPFCHNKSGSVLDKHFEQNLEFLKEKGCPSSVVNKFAV